MKRARDLFQKIISDSNLETAIKTVCNSHRWIHYPSKPNKKVLWLESDMKSHVKELREIIERGFEPSEVTKKRRYDRNAGKWRDIAEPKLWPDQCVHHALIQVLESIMMRGMDKWCCGSIKKRGAHYGIKAIRKWMDETGGKKTRWCVECDIRHFYDSLKPQQVMNRMKRLIKDHRTLDLIYRIVRDGILIGAYCSQWFANTFLQPLDQLIRESGASHYIRYMDNFTIFTTTKRTADKIIFVISKWLEEHELRLKGNWQKFKIRKHMPKESTREQRMKRRLPNALGYRFGRGFVLIRKKNLLRLRQCLERFYSMRERGKFIPVKFAQGLLSRLGMLRHCNSKQLYKRFVKKHTQRHLKDVVREYYRKECERWNLFLEKQCAAA